MKASLSRRRFLKALAAAPVLCGLPMLTAQRLLANPMQVPQRVLFYRVSYGVLPKAWEPIGLGEAPPTETAWALGEFKKLGTGEPFRVMEALEPYKNRINMFKNLEMVSERYDTTPSNSGHLNGATHFMTATPRLPGDSGNAGSISIDKFIAQELSAQQGVITRLPSLEVGASETGTNSNLTYSSLSWGGPGQKLSPIGRPEQVYEQAFKALLLKPEELERSRNARAFLKERFASASSYSLAEQDRRMIKSHMQLREDLYERAKAHSARDAHFSNLTPGNGNLPGGYEALLSQWNQNKGSSGSGKQWRETSAINAKLAAYALYTDSTRVLSFSHSKAPSELFNFYSRKFAGAGDWHDLDHKVAPVDEASKHQNFRIGTEAYTTIARMQQLEFEQLAMLLGELDNLEESDGSTLLDNTLVVITSHIGNGNHDVANLPWMTIGSAQGRLKTNRYFELERAKHPKNASQTVGRGHGDFFASIMLAMGLDAMPRDPDDDTSTRDRFGMPEASRGAITEMFM